MAPAIATIATASLLLLTGTTIMVDAHPAGLACMTDAENVLKLGATIMGMPVTAYPGPKVTSYAGEVNTATSGVDVQLKLEIDTAAATEKQATITLSGPSALWFGVGFDAQTMADTPYTIYVNGTGGIHEQKLADHAPGTALTPLTVAKVSDTVDKHLGVRTVVMTRALKGKDADHYSFDVATLTTGINVIVAVGTGPSFGYHKAHAQGLLKIAATTLGTMRSASAVTLTATTKPPSAGGACVLGKGYIPGERVWIQLDNIPAGAYFAIRASGQAGAFDPKADQPTLPKGTSGVATTTGCPSQLIAPGPNAPPATNGAYWTLPCSSTVGDVTFAAVWSEGPAKVKPTDGAFLYYLAVTLKRNTAWDCSAILDPDTFRLRWQLDTSAKTLQNQLTYTGANAGDVWLAGGFSTTGKMIPDATDATGKGYSVAAIYKPGTTPPLVQEYKIGGYNVSKIVPLSAATTSVTHSSGAQVTTKTSPSTTMTWTRTWATKDDTVCTFDPETPAHFIYAAGSSDTFAKHAFQGHTALTFDTGKPPQAPTTTPTAGPTTSATQGTGSLTLPNGVSVTLTLDTATAPPRAVITLTGPSDSWFGIGFGATSMADKPYTVVIGDDGTVIQTQLGDHTAGTKMPKASMQLLSNTARRRSAEHLLTTKALRCTAATWILTVAESFAKF